MRCLATLMCCTTRWTFSTVSESGQRGRVIRALKPLNAKAIENPIGPGTPDVNYIEGWIELKWLRAWPVKSDTVVRLPHFTIGQRRWLRDRSRLGGNAWLLLQCKQEWLLFTGPDAHDYVGKMTREGLYRCCRMRWTRGLKDKELVECLKRDWDNWNGLPWVSDS